MFKKLLSIALSVVTMVELIPRVPAIAEEAERYPYVFFASSEEDNAITINSNNICINGNIATNGTISSNAQYFNVNGTKTEHADEDPVLFFSKIESTYLKSHVETYFEDYFLNETNINVNIPIEVEGNIEFNGNINITSGIKALNDITLSGNVENAYDSVICAETGDININTENINLNGLVYAPKGCVNITAQNLNINGVIIIADTIIINCPNLNANYNANMAEFIGSKNVSENDEELEIAAYGGQKNESDVYNIYWNTTIPDGTFDVQISDNGEEYSSIGNVVNTDSLEYHFTETFEKRYIKVVQTANDGKVSESVPFIVSYTENGFDTKFLDSDEDGLPDIYELKIGTDINSSDTDNDGLSDFREYVFTQTDPLIYDSVTKGIPDSDIDSDEDGLSNIDEFTRGTSPCNSDSDNDGLIDYDEIYIYNTDPLNSDSDGDGINDNSEIKLELDPNNASTNGIPDNEYVIPQNIEANSSVFSSINSEDSPYQLSIDILTNRDAENELEVNKSAYSAVIENDAMIGSSIDVDISDTCEPEKIVLKYNISEDYVQNRLNKYSSFEEFQGIKRLNVFKFDEEQKMLKPVETEFDVSNDQLYAEVNETGTYCLMDMEIWFDELGVEIDEDTSDEETSTSYSLKLDDHVSIMSQESPKTYEFDGHKYEIIDHMDLTWSEAKEYCENIGGHLLTIASVQEQEFVEKNILVNAAKNAYWLGGYKDYNTWKWITGEHFFYSNWFKGINENQPDNWGGSEDKLSIYRLNNPKHKGKSANYWNDLNDSGIVGSESFFGVENIGFICEWESTVIPTEEYTLYYANNWKKVNLRGKLSPDNKIDSDGDTLTDWEEVDTSRLTWHSGGNFEFPVINMSYFLKDISRFNTYEFMSLLKNMKPITYVPVLSDPSLVDTDGDEWDDLIDPNKLESDFKIKKLKHDSYLRLDHYDLYQNNGHEIKYGSNQSWFEDFKALSELYIFSKGEIDYKLAVTNGCGLIAAADTIAYLDLYNNMDSYDLIQYLIRYDRIYGYPTSQTTHTTTKNDTDEVTNDQPLFPGYNPINDTIDYYDYINYARLLSHEITICDNEADTFPPGLQFIAKHFDFSSGVIPIGLNSIKACFNYWFKLADIPYEAKWRNDNSRDTLYNRISSMLNNNIPVIISYDVTEALHLYFDYTSKERYDTTQSHYMVITEIIDFSDEMSNKYNHSTLLKVSSWGKVRYIDLDEYCSLVNHEKSNNFSLFDKIISNFSSNILEIKEK